MSLTPGTRLGPYEIGALIGKGGMGEVDRGRDTRLQRDVAIKVLPEQLARDSERMARFEREAQLLASVNHPHIAQIYGLEQSTSATCIVMELVDGETLDERIANHRALPLEQVRHLALQIVNALAAAHDRGVIHRDSSPPISRSRPRWHQAARFRPGKDERRRVRNRLGPSR